MQSLWMVVAAVFYAFYGVFIKWAGELGVGSWQVLFYRSFFGLVLFYIMMRSKGVAPGTRHPASHAVRSIAGTGAIIAGIYSISHLNLGLAMTLNYTAPLFLGVFVVGYSLMHHARINWGLMLSLVTGFIGVLVLLGPTIGPHEYFAAGVGLTAGLCTAVATGFVKRLGMYREPEPRIIFYLMLAGTVCGAAGVVSMGGFTPWTLERFYWIAGLSICAALGQLTLTRAFSRGNMVLSGALQYSVILFSTVMGEIVFDEAVTLAVVAGMVIIVVSGFSASWFTKKEEKLLRDKKKAAKAAAEQTD